MAEVFVVGDAGGLGGAKLALAQGRLAGARIAADLNAPRPAGAAAIARLEREIRGHRRFQAALWDLFAAPRLTIELATADTTICRCESLTLGQIEQAVGSGSASVASVKKTTRAGMGRCQGRYCSASLDAILPAPPAAEEGFFAPRPPVKPVPIGLLAGRAGQEIADRDLFAGPPGDPSGTG